MKKGTSNLGFKMSRKYLASEQVYGCEARCVQWKSVIGNYMQPGVAREKMQGGPLGFFRTGDSV